MISCFDVPVEPKFKFAWHGDKKMYIIKNYYVTQCLRMFGGSLRNFRRTLRFLSTIDGLEIKNWRNVFLIEHFGARFNTDRAPNELPNQNYKQFVNE